MISKDTRIELYRKVFQIRTCEETIRKEYHKNEMKTPVHLCNGSEGIAAGVRAALTANSTIFGSYRNHGLYLAITDDTDGFFGEMFGKEIGCAQGKAGSMHLTSPSKGLFLTSAVVGTTIPVAVGVAFANQYKGSNASVVSFFGDGAMEEGIFWESINFACLKKLRIFFICEDNDLAIHALGHERRGFKSVLDVVRGFDCHVMSGNGSSPASVYETAQHALKKMNEDPRPAFLHFEYFRYLEHVGIAEDFSAGYRRHPDQKTLGERDPVLNAKKEALQAGVSETQITQVEEMIHQKIQASVERARRASFPEPHVLTDHVVS